MLNVIAYKLWEVGKWVKDNLSFGHWEQMFQALLLKGFPCYFSKIVAEKSWTLFKLGRGGGLGFCFPLPGNICNL